MRRIIGFFSMGEVRKSKFIIKWLVGFYNKDLVLVIVVDNLDVYSW